jgi:putative transposase
MLPRMAIPSRANNHGTYFVTSRTYNSRRLFQSEQNGQLFLDTKLSVWQRGFTDHRIRDREDWDKHLAYIHDNPVRAKLCQRPEDYPFSSVFRRADLRG